MVCIFFWEIVKFFVIFKNDGKYILMVSGGSIVIIFKIIKKYGCGFFLFIKNF